jgi:tetratricopeptide (TPR) repeat protein
MDKIESIEIDQKDPQEESSSEENTPSTKSSMSWSMFGVTFTIVFEEAVKFFKRLYNWVIHHPIISIVLVSFVLSGGIVSCIHHQQIQKFQTAYHFLWAGQPADAKKLFYGIAPFKYSIYNSDAIRAGLVKACLYSQPLDTCKQTMDNTATPWQKIITAHTLYYSGQLDDARKHYQEIIDQKCFDNQFVIIDAYLGKARCLYQLAKNQSELDTIKETIDRILDIDLNCGIAHILDGLVHMDNFEFQDAHDKFQDADMYVYRRNDPLEKQPLAWINTYLKKEMKKIIDFVGSKKEIQYKKMVNDQEFSPKWLMIPLKPLANYSPWINEEYVVTKCIQNHLQSIQDQLSYDPLLLRYTYLKLKKKPDRFFTIEDIEGMIKYLNLEYLITGTFQYTDRHDIKINFNVYGKDLSITPIMVSDSNRQSIVEKSAKALDHIINKNK